jgi:hypothetical protein
LRRAINPHRPDVREIVYIDIRSFGPVRTERKNTEPFMAVVTDPN